MKQNGVGLRICPVNIDLFLRARRLLARVYQLMAQLNMILFLILLFLAE